jgi:3-phenylpropionate/trans-cinnamate dioxygenase ferredoxin reductase component
MREYRYVIVGAGLAGAEAVEGIRGRDNSGTILLLGTERNLPYHRPPLTKDLWFGKKQVHQIFVHEADFYRQHAVEVKTGTEVTRLDPAGHILRDAAGEEYRYGKLLLATGGTPQRLMIAGADLDGVNYFRRLPDYEALRAAASAGKRAVVIGGGFIGSEIAAALTTSGIKVTMLFPGEWLVWRVFPEPLGRALTRRYREKGVEVLTREMPTAIERTGQEFLVRTRERRELRADMVVVGIGIAPNVDLARGAGLTVGNGITVNEFLQTSDPDIYAAGDVAEFPEAMLGMRRIEHWDNAKKQGAHAGANMAGAAAPFKELPMFFSDLFEFGYEAVGDVSTRLETFADWQEENKKGVIYYLDGGKVRGVMMCNVWEKTPAARALIRDGRAWGNGALRGVIR